MSNHDLFWIQNKIKVYTSVLEYSIHGLVCAMSSPEHNKCKR